MGLSNQSYASFFIRLWQEPREGADPPVWRGSIEHVQSGHRRHFLENEVPLPFIAEIMDETSADEEPRAYID